MSKMNFLEKIRVETTCSEDWNEMRGGEQVRFCSHCSKSVNNLSTMTRREASKIVKESNGNLCVRYAKNPANDAPLYAEDLIQIARRAPRLAVGVVTAALSLSSMAYAQGGARATREPIEKTEISQDKDSAKNKTESPTARLSGTLLDSQGAVIPGVQITLASDKTGESKFVTTDDEGFYQFQDIETGTYNLKTEGGRGFREKEITGITVTQADSQQDIILEVGDTVELMGVVAFSPEYANPLFNAVNDGNLAEIKNLIGKGENVNVRDENYSNITPLFLAVETGNLEIVQALLNFGAKINARDENKQTPLMQLDADAEPELVKLLLSYGARIKAVDKGRNTVLHHAAALVSREVLQMLIDEGASIDAQNEEGGTPLMAAVEYENLEAVRTLLEAGADANLRDEDGATALANARANDYQEIAELLISYGATE